MPSNQIAVLLNVGTAEVAGVCVLTGIFCLVFRKSLSIRKVDECINNVLNKTSAERSQLDLIASARQA